MFCGHIVAIGPFRQATVMLQVGAKTVQPHLLPFSILLCRGLLNENEVTQNEQVINLFNIGLPLSLFNSMP